MPKTTDSKHNLRVSPNLLQDGINAPAEKGVVIIGDITYLPLMGGGFCYLACFQDKFTRRIVGWSVSSWMTTQFAGGRFFLRCGSADSKTVGYDTFLVWIVNRRF